MTSRAQLSNEGERERERESERERERERGREREGERERERGSKREVCLKLTWCISKEVASIFKMHCSSSFLVPSSL